MKGKIKIGGWLLIPFIGFHVIPIWITYTTGAFILDLSDGIWLLVTDTGTKLYNPLVAPFFVFEIAANISLIILSVIVLYLMHIRKKSAPRFAITYYLASVVVLFIDICGAALILANYYPPIAEKLLTQVSIELAIAFLAASIWIPYFLRSDRVGETFAK